VAPLSLLPCASSTNLSNCVAAAVDATDGDISSKITVTEITPCGVNATITQCVRCSAAQATVGNCLPGTYVSQFAGAGLQQCALSAIPPHCLCIS
jgi:hypothetical protein